MSVVIFQDDNRRRNMIFVAKYFFHTMVMEGNISIGKTATECFMSSTSQCKFLLPFFVATVRHGLFSLQNEIRKSQNLQNEFCHKTRFVTKFHVLVMIFLIVCSHLNHILPTHDQRPLCKTSAIKWLIHKKKWLIHRKSSCLAYFI